jgi:hypothetical protein
LDESREEDQWAAGRRLRELRTRVKAGSPIKPNIELQVCSGSIVISGGGSLRFFRNRVRACSLITLAAVVAVILILPLTPVAIGLVYHSECRTGLMLNQTDLWTPWIVLDSPFKGSSQATAVGSNPNGSITSSGPPVAANGSAVAEFSLNRWTLWSLSTVLVLGAGTDAPCQGSYTAVIDSRPIPFENGGASRFLINVSLLGSGNESDAVQPNWVSILGYRSVDFGVPFVNNANFVDTCANGGTALNESLAPRVAAVGVPFHLASGNVTVALWISAQGDYVYHYPGDAGVWWLMLNPTGAFSFEWTSCPS